MARYTKKIFIWLPREDTIFKHIFINGADYTNSVKNGTFSKAINSEVGDFFIELFDPDGTFSDSFAVGQEVILTIDEKTDDITRRFRGKIQKIWSKIVGNVNILFISGYHISYQILNKFVTASYSETYSSILSTLISEKTDYTITNLDTTTDIYTVNWEEKLLLDCIKQIAIDSGYDFYVDDGGDTHFFESGSVENLDEALVLTNFEKMEYFGDDSLNLKNKVLFSGSTTDGLPIIYTSEDSASIDLYGEREVIIKDAKSNTSVEVENRSASELVVRKNPITRGKFVTNQYLLTLKPGDLIWVSIPSKKIHGQYVVQKLIHSFPNSSTTVQFKEDLSSLSKLLKDRASNTDRIENLPSNHNYHYSWAFPFDDATDIAELDDSQVTGGALTLATGQTTGTMTTTVKNTASSPGVIAQVRLKVSGTNLDNCTYVVSLDNLNEKTVTPDSDYIAGSIEAAANFIHSGVTMYIKVNLAQVAGLNPVINNMVLLFDT